MKNKKKIIAKIALFAFLLLFAFVNVVYAKTKSDLNFCKQPGVLRTMKIIGLVISVIKIAVPVIIVGTGMFKFAEVVISGKEEDFKESAKTVMKKVFAGIIVFMLPGVIHYIYTNVVDSNGVSEFANCEACLNEPNGCKIPDKAPDIYTD